MPNTKLLKGDCLSVMKELDDKSVDLVICDLPYGETNCKWDTCIDLEEFWKEFKRIRKSKKTACIHFCSTKFGYQLIKSWEKGFKMDMVWKKRNKTGGLSSRYRPMRAHEMVYFFYEQAPKYNRDKYHKRIKQLLPKPKEEQKTGESIYGIVDDHSFNAKDPANNKNFDPHLPSSYQEIKEEMSDHTLDSKGNYSKPAFPEVGVRYKKENNTSSKYEPTQPGSVVDEPPDEWGYQLKKLNPETRGKEGFEPVLPVTVVEDIERKNKKDYKKGEEVYSECAWEGQPVKFKDGGGIGPKWDPKLPESTIEPDHVIKDDGKGNRVKIYFAEKGNKDAFGYDKDYTGKTIGQPHFDPPQPVSVMKESIYGMEYDPKEHGFHSKASFEPIQPDSCLLLADDEPGSIYHSKKCFIGKRNHQTEKPIDILLFFLRYWSDPDSVVLDPTMGSGSTGVACKKLGRSFIGIELTDEYYKVAQKRIEETKEIKDDLLIDSAL